MHVRAGVDVADDALAGRDARVVKLVLDRVARLVLGNRRVGAAKLVPRLPYLAYGPGVDRRAVVGVDDVAGGAAAGAVVAGVVVGAQEVERRIEQPRLLQADEHRIGAVLGAQAADR